MKLEIEEHQNGFIVKYYKWNEIYGAYHEESTYVYKATEDLLMIEKIVEKFLKRRIKIEEK